MVHVEEINDIDAIRRYRLNWELLLAKTRGATFFQSLDWLETYWRHFGDRQALRALVVSSADRPIGILPLTVVRERTRLGTVRVLTYPLDGWGTFFGPIGPDLAATLLAGLRHIAATPRDWDLVDLRWIDADGDDAGRSRNAMRSTGLPAVCRPFVHATQIEIEAVGDGGWQAYWSTRKPRFRQNIARAERLLAAVGEVSYLRYRPEGSRYDDGDPRWDLYDACESIAGRSWQGGATDGTTLSHDSVRDYLRDAHQTAARAGGLDLNLLLVGGRPAAFAYNYHYRGSVYGLRMGFDPSIATAGSGGVLLRRMIEDSFARGDRLIDLGPGSLEMKRHWATRVQTSYHCPHYAQSAPKAQALRIKRWLAGMRA